MDKKNCSSYVTSHILKQMLIAMMCQRIQKIGTPTYVKIGVATDARRKKISFVCAEDFFNP